MNDNIIYFGDFSTKSPMVKRLMDLRNNKAFKNTFSVPVHYGISVEDAKNCTSSSMSWPIEAAIVNEAGDNAIIEFTLCKDHKDLQKLVKNSKITKENSEIVIRKPTSAHVKNSIVEGFMILGVDFVSFNNSKGEVVSFSVDNKDFFEKNDMDANFAYRVGHNGSYNYFDNMINRNNPIFNEVLSKKDFLSAIPKSGKRFAEIKKSYLHGFACGFSSRPTFLTKIGVETFSDEILTSFMVGNIISNFIFWMLRKKIPYSMPQFDFTDDSTWEAVSVYISALYNVSEGNIKDNISNICAIHSIFLGKPPKSVSKTTLSKELSEISSAYWDLNNSSSIKLSDLIHNELHVISQIFNHKSLLSSFDLEKAAKNAKPIELKVFDSLKSSNEITLSKAQIRTTGESSGNSIPIRIQLFDLGVKSSLINDGKQITAKNNKHGNVEKDYKITMSDLAGHYDSMQNFFDKLKSLKHTEKSQAGTGVMYIPLIMSEDGLRAKEDNSMIIPIEYLTSRFSKEDNSFTSILNILKNVN